MYEVGQFIYFFAKEKNQIFSAKVVEEITIKTLNGIEKDYTVNIKNTDDSTFSLSDLVKAKGYKTFDTEDKLKEHMINGATSYINKLVDKCNEQKKKVWGKTQKDVISDIALQNTEAIEKIQVDLGDGTKANIIDNTGLIGLEGDQKKNEYSAS